MIFTGSWDKMVRAMDLKTNAIVKSFIASKESIKCIKVDQQNIFVAGCDSIIRSFNIETGNTKMYQGHRGWVYALEIHEYNLSS